MKTVITILLVIGTINWGQAQMIAPADTALLKKEMSQLSALVGHWEGSGWMMDDQRQKHSFEQEEIVRYKLDQTALLIEGKGKNNGKLIHNALAIVTFDTNKKHYNFRSYLSQGHSGDYKMEIMEPNVIYWYPTDKVRYIIKVNSDTWHEVGEYNYENNWYRFFEMTLEKK